MKLELSYLEVMREEESGMYVGYAAGRIHPTWVQRWILGDHSTKFRGQYTRANRDA